jgi:transcriptional regulator with XRE-family HTH domain
MGIFFPLNGKYCIFVANNQYMDRNLLAAEAIKRLRKEKKISLQEMADLVKKSKSAWARKESGDVDITLNEAEEVAKILGTDFDVITQSGKTIHNTNNGNFINQGEHSSLNLHLTDEQFKEFSNIFKEKKRQ